MSLQILRFFSHNLGDFSPLVCQVILWLTSSETYFPSSSILFFYCYNFLCWEGSSIISSYKNSSKLIPDHLTCLLRNLYAGQEATVRRGWVGYKQLPSHFRWTSTKGKRGRSHQPRENLWRNVQVSARSNQHSQQGDRFSVREERVGQNMHHMPSTYYKPPCTYTNGAFKPLYLTDLLKMKQLGIGGGRIGVHKIWFQNWGFCSIFNKMP